MDDASREIHRSRWRREREKLGLMDVRQEAFAKGGFGQYVPNLTVRLVVLGADPERELINFDNEFWSWWKTDRETPFGTGRNDWGHVTPTPNAAVRHHRHLNKSWIWDSYVALYRHGGLDVGLGGDGAAVMADKKMCFSAHSNCGASVECTRPLPRSRSTIRDKRALGVFACHTRNV